MVGCFNATNNTSFNPEPQEIVFSLFKQSLAGHRAVHVRKVHYTFLYMMYYTYSNKLKDSSIILSGFVNCWFSLTWSTAMFFNENKRKRLHNNGDKFPEDLVGAPTWPPFLCLGAPTWRSWRHVKTENKINFKYKVEKFTWFNLLYWPSLIVHSVPVHGSMRLATYSWLALTWLDGHVGIQTKSKMSLAFCIIIEPNSQKTFSPSFRTPTWPLWRQVQAKDYILFWLDVNL